MTNNENETSKPDVSLPVGETTEHFIDEEGITLNEVEAKIEQERVEEPKPTPILEKDAVEIKEPTKPVDETLTNTRKKQRVRVVGTISEEGSLDSIESIELPSDHSKETSELSANLPNINMIGTPSEQEWAYVVTRGLESTALKDAFRSNLENEKSDYTNNLEVNGKTIAGAKPRYSHIENSKLQGEKAVIRITQSLGLGTLFQVPLWNSGVWVTIKPPSESELIELHRAMLSAKVAFGRSTYGLAFSASTSYINSYILSFIVDHIYTISVNAEELPREKILENIACQDMYNLMWGMVCSIYPDGFNFSRACITDPSKCNYVAKEILNVTKLQFVNKSALSEEQRDFMSDNRPNKKSLADIKRYKQQALCTKDLRFELFSNNKPYYITIGSPSLADYISSGKSWISSIIEAVESVVEKDASREHKENLMISHSAATTMRQYDCWVKSIEVDTNIVEDPETIKSVLGVLSSHDNSRLKFLETVYEYISSSTISVIGIPVYDCPKCNTPQDNTDMKDPFKNIIPLDMTQVFFDLLIQRLNRLTER